MSSQASSTWVRIFPTVAVPGDVQFSFSVRNANKEIRASGVLWVRHVRESALVLHAEVGGSVFCDFGWPIPGARVTSTTGPIDVQPVATSLRVTARDTRRPMDNQPFRVVIDNGSVSVHILGRLIVRTVDEIPSPDWFC